MTRRELLPGACVGFIVVDVLLSVLIGSPLPMVGTPGLAVVAAAVIGPPEAPRS